MTEPLPQAPPPPPSDAATEVLHWRTLAQNRADVIRALHEFNYWHESTVARGEVIAGLEQSVALWRERALAAEARCSAAPVAGTPPRAQVTATTRAAARRVRRVVRSRLVRLPTSRGR